MKTQSFPIGTQLFAPRLQFREKFTSIIRFLLPQQDLRKLVTLCQLQIHVAT